MTNYGSQKSKERAKRLLEVLLDYPQLVVDDKVKKSLKVNPLNNSSGLFVLGTLKSLSELTKAGKYQERLTESHVQEAIAYLEKYLGILTRPKNQGSREWELTIKLWHSDKKKNLEQFEQECKRKDAEKKPQASKDPWVWVRKFIPSNFDLLDEKFFEDRGKGEAQILRLSSAAWSLVTQGSYIERDQQQDALALAEELAKYDGISLLLIRGEPGAGKTALMRWLAYQLYQERRIVLQKKPYREDFYWIESLREFSKQIRNQHFYLIADDLFRDDSIVEELKTNELQFPLTLIGTTNFHDNKQEELRRGIHRIKHLDLELHQTEKKRILYGICQQDPEAKARLDKMTSAERQHLMAASTMLVVMLQLSEGKEFDSIIADIIKRLPREKDYPVYEVFGVISSFFQYGITTLPKVLPLCLPEYSKKAVMNVVNNATVELNGLVNTMSKDGFKGLTTIHELIAKTAISLRYKYSKPTENLPYYPDSLEDYLTSIIKTLDPTKQNEKRWLFNALRRLAFNEKLELVRQILNDYPEQIQVLEQDSKIYDYSYLEKMYEAADLPAKQKNILKKIISTEPENEWEWFYRLSVTEKHGTEEQKQEAICQTAVFLKDHPENTGIRTKYLVLVAECGTEDQKKEAIDQTMLWLEQNPEDMLVGLQYLELIKQYGNCKQKKEAIDQTTIWLQNYPNHTLVRVQHLALIEEIGTTKQIQKAIVQTTDWLQKHPENSTVRLYYLVLVRKAIKDIVDIELIISNQWQWFNQQEELEQSLWIVFLSVLYVYAQPELIQRAVNIALCKYPNDREIQEFVYSYFQEYLDATDFSL